MKNNTNYVSASFDDNERPTKDLSFYTINSDGEMTIKTLPLRVEVEHFVKIPETVGILKITDDFHVHLLNKPNFIHRWFMRLLLGWKWEDKK